MKRRSDSLCVTGAAQHGAQRRGALQTRDRSELGIRNGPGSAVHRSAVAPRCTASRTCGINRRAFIALLGGAAASAAWPITARAQAPAMPVVGLLRSTPEAPFRHLVAALRQGLADEGIVEGRNVSIEQRYADNQLDRLPGLAADLIRRQVAAIIGNVAAVEAARAATSTIPIIFVTGEDPVASGLVKSISRPEANLTGVTFFGGSQLNMKQLELLRDLVPSATIVAVLGDPNYPGFDRGFSGVMAAGRALGWRIVTEKAETEREFEPVFAKFAQARADALLVSGSPFFTSQRRTLEHVPAQLNRRIPAGH
jgi:putative ABC transport system substrate-binding protein